MGKTPYLGFGNEPSIALNQILYMALYTSSYLKNLANNLPLNESTRMFSESRNQKTFDIFLSHSFLDKKEVEGLYIELKSMGFSVYVDWIVDSQLDRGNVTKESATLVRERLKASKSLLLAISVNASVSKWMPWELGYKDGHTSNCAIVPVSHAQYAPASYKGVEYLSLYPFISNANDMQGNRTLWAVESANRYNTLREFIGGTKPYVRGSNIY